MKYRTVFDIIVPVMIGLSSSYIKALSFAKVGTDVMYKIGETIPEALRETAQGGLAATPKVRELVAKIYGVSLDKV